MTSVRPLGGGFPSPEESETFRIFRDHCIALSRLVSLFNDFFGTDDQRQMDKWAPAKGFFADLNSMMRDHYFLSVARLGDPARSGRNLRNENLSYTWFVARLEENGVVVDGLDGARNKRIAHGDLPTLRDGNVLGASEVLDPDDFVDGINDFCDLIAEAFSHSKTDFRRMSDPVNGDASSLLRLLQDRAHFDRFFDRLGQVTGQDAEQLKAIAFEVGDPDIERPEAIVREFLSKIKVAVT